MRYILLTGGTGAIGSVLTRYLLEEPETRVRLLVRARSTAHLAERLTTLLSFLEIDPADAVRQRVEAVAGDVMLPRLGLESADYDRLARSVTHVVHSAGNVKLNRPLEDARRAAVDSARHVVSFVDACAAHGQFVKAEFVSTVGVAGRMPGLIPERFLCEPREFRNTYEAAKAEAEQVLTEQIGRGLPATIHRPSMVVGHSSTGTIIQFQVFYHLCEFLSGARTAGVIPDAGETRLDIIPVDYVARAIQASSLAPEARGQVFHLCSGPTHAPTINTLASQVQEIFATHGRRVRTLRSVSPSVLRALVSMATPLSSGRFRGALQALPYFLAYLHEPQTFDNERTQAFFTPRGVVVPSVASYLRTVLSYYLTRDRASNEARRVAS